MSFIDLFKDQISDLVNRYRTRSYRTNVIFSDFDYANAIFEFLRNSIYWNRFKYRCGNRVLSGKTLNDKHIEFCKMGVYEELYKRVLRLYFSENMYEKLRYQSTDTSFIPNKGCSELIGRNVAYKNKNGIKISDIVDANGVPISLTLGCGSEADSVLFNETYSNFFIDPKTSKYKKSKKLKQYFFMDSAYETNEIINKLINDGYTTLTVKNLRNSKKENYIIKKLRNKDHQLYNKRIINENSFSWIKQYGILNHIYEKSIMSYRGLLLLALSYTVYNKNLNILNQKQLDENNKKKQLELKQRKKEQRRIKYRLDKQKREKEKNDRKEHKGKQQRQAKNCKGILYETNFGNKKWYIIIESG